MARGKHAPQTVETNPAGRAGRSPADTEWPGVDPEISDRPAHAWEVDGAEAWDPVMPDTWDPPVEPGPGPAAATGSPSMAGEDTREETKAAGDNEAAWDNEAARSAGTARRHGATGDDGAIGQDEATRSAGAAWNDDPVHDQDRGEWPRTDESGRPPQPPATRLALGLASLAAQRMRAGVPAGDGLVTGLGLMRQTVNGLVALGERLLTPASKMAADALRRAEALPVVGPPIYAGLQSRQWLSQSRDQARAALAAAVSSWRGEGSRAATASAAGKSTVDKYGG